MCCNRPFLFDGKKSFSWQHVDAPSPTIYRIVWFVDVNFWHQTSYAEKGLILIKEHKNERFLSVSVDLSHVMTALWKLEKFNLTMLMSSFISLWFGKRVFFYLNNMGRLIRTPRGLLIRGHFLWSLQSHLSVLRGLTVLPFLFMVLPHVPPSLVMLVSFAAVIRVVTRHATLLPSAKETILMPGTGGFFSWDVMTDVSCDLEESSCSPLYFALPTISIGRRNHCV